jgi:hypothetical protein
MYSQTRRIVCDHSVSGIKLGDFVSGESFLVDFFLFRTLLCFRQMKKLVL